MTRTAAVLGASAGLVAIVWAVLHVGWYGSDQIVDYSVYQHYGISVVHQGAVPYRDFRMEYPPAALPVFVIPSLFAQSDYQYVFQLLMAVCEGLIVAAAAALGGWRAALPALLAPLALGSLVYSRFDLWPAALTMLALLALLRGRLALAALLVGTAFAAKLWPVLLVPPMLVWLARSRGRAAAAWWLGAATATAAVWFAPFVALAPGGLGFSFHDQLARPLQIESLGGAVLIALHKTTGHAVRVVGSFGSQNLAGPGAHAAAVASTTVTAAAVIAVWAAFARGPASEERLLVACAGSITAAIAFGKVFSPQFLIWLVPLVPLLRGRRGSWALALFGSALVLTQLWFPHHYWDMVAFQSPYTWFVLARDLVVVALAGVLAWPQLGHEAFGQGRARVEALRRVRAEAS
jgi:hypothetical protein